jgi:hypothetical protein
MRMFILAIVATCAFQWGHAVDNLAALRSKAEQGDPAAQTQVGFLYYRGQGTAANPEVAVSWWKKAARQGYAPAMVALGRAYYNGKATGTGLDEDFPEAWIWFQLAIHAGDSSAAEDARHTEVELGAFRLNSARLRLGDALIQGERTPKDIPSAVQAYQAAAQDGLVPAQLRLMDIYLSGELMPPDLAAAGDVCVLMAKLMHGEGHYCRARLELSAVAPDWKKVVSEYTAALAWRDPRPMSELADLYAEGINVRRDDPRAFFLYSDAMDVVNGGILQEPTAEQMSLNEQLAVRMRTVAARTGLAGLEALAKDNTHVRALLRLAERYYTGEIAAADLPTVGKVCAVLDRRNLPEAHYCRARAGRASPNPNWKRIVSEYLAASSSSDPRPSFELAELYVEGSHIGRDDLRAMVLYSWTRDVLKHQWLNSTLDPQQADSLKSLVLAQIDALGKRMSATGLQEVQRALQDPRERTKLLKP